LFFRRFSEGLSKFVGWASYFGSLTASSAHLLRKITDHVKQFYNLKVNCSTVLRWIQRYTELMDNYSKELVPQVSGKWHADETVENVNGKNKWLWNL